MKDHFNLSDKAYKQLLKEKVTIKDFFKTAKLFDPENVGAGATKVGLLYYIDKKGDFNQPPKFSHKRIALAVFESLNIKDQIMVAEYIEVMENNWEEVDYDLDEV